MKILVIGSSGMLGHMVTLYLINMGYDVINISKSRKVNEKTILVDVLDNKSLNMILNYDFDYIINCAAILVKKSEENKTNAIMLNSYFPHKLAELLKNTKTRIIQVSSDGVFSGLNAPYDEDSLTDSNTFYGKTKILGELIDDKNLTIRTSIVGPDLYDGVGLFNWFVNQNAVVNGYKNTLFNAVTTLEFAKFIEVIIRNPISGVYHLCSNQTMSKADFISMVKEEFNLKNITINKIENNFTDNSLKSNREDIDYIQKSYFCMIKELKQYMINNKEIYRNYKFLRSLNV
ncbi:SDR family oxidoreductase [Sedimentibacter sp. zth1]|uniref:dTDP-4-dehydrorhamnose reductase family protein n=1 Tax=Sedimentibacter sp. zth1 TaxID=2816908 RepID=UPI001A930AC5|nr:SDR family oxidoreductase [Sedimentibacter sp. zth1]QSX07147.1 SDR family oxidoreductase [Sedimentibacter sp. zth1]